LSWTSHFNSAIIAGKMSYELDIKKEKNYLYIRASGNRTRDGIASMAREVIESCHKYQIYEVLVDLRDLKGPMGIFDSLWIVTKEFPKLTDLKAIKKAAVMNAKERKERSGFFEQIAIKRGYNIRFFDELTPAIEWLKSGKPVTSTV